MFSKFDQVRFIDTNWGIELSIADSYRALLEGVTAAESRVRQKEWEEWWGSLSPKEKLVSLYPSLPVSAMAFFDDEDDDGETRPYCITDNGTAIIPIKGIVTKDPTSAMWLFGGTSTAQVRAMLAQAKGDNLVKRVLLLTDSPGGGVKGTDELARDIREFKSVKPIYAYCDDMACSCGYYIPSGATKIFANKAALLMNMGVYQVLADSSEMFKALGVKVVVIKSAEFKAIGEDGTEITLPQIEEVKRTVMAFHNLFVDAVAEGRGMDRDKVAKAADGSTHISTEALEMGFIDEICSFYDCLEKISAGDEPAGQSAATNGTTSTGEKLMADTPKAGLLSGLIGLFKQNGIDLEAAGGGDSPNAAVPDDPTKAENQTLKAEVARLTALTAAKPETPKAEEPKGYTAMAEMLVGVCAKDHDEKVQAAMLPLAVAALAADGGKVGEACEVFKAMAEGVPPMDEKQKARAAKLDMSNKHLVIAQPNTTKAQEKAAAAASAAAKPGSVQSFYGRKN